MLPPLTNARGYCTPTVSISVPRNHWPVSRRPVGSGRHTGGLIGCDATGNPDRGAGAQAIQPCRFDRPRRVGELEAGVKVQGDATIVVDSDLVGSVIESSWRCSTRPQTRPGVALRKGSVARMVAARKNGNGNQGSKVGAWTNATVSGLSPGRDINAELLRQRDARGCLGDRKGALVGATGAAGRAWRWRFLHRRSMSISARQALPACAWRRCRRSDARNRTGPGSDVGEGRCACVFGPAPAITSICAPEAAAVSAGPDRPRARRTGPVVRSVRSRRRPPETLVHRPSAAPTAVVARHASAG